MKINQRPIDGWIGYDSMMGEYFAPAIHETEEHDRRPKFPKSDFNKAVRIDACNYAATEKDAIKGYNQLIQNAIECHEQEITKLKGAKL